MKVIVMKVMMMMVMMMMVMVLPQTTRPMALLTSRRQAAEPRSMMAWS